MHTIALTHAIALSRTIALTDNNCELALSIAPTNQNAPLHNVSNGSRSLVQLPALERSLV